ncbi:hypothetical protein CSPX01_04082 [Colletotrichum filicis]|nr:hypothetical protein CSPX01_04082 [Colletotrichum filicis]
MALFLNYQATLFKFAWRRTKTRCLPPLRHRPSPNLDSLRPSPSPYLR